jgi:putative ABC transport system permease protein
MNILTKYLIKSILEKKGILVLILISISVSTALLVASLGSADSIINNYNEKIKGVYENFNVVITPNEKAAYLFFTTDNINMSKVKDSFKMMDTEGYVKSNDEKQFNMVGTTISDLQKFRSIKMIKKNNLNSFNGNEIIISEKTGKNLGVNINDEIELSILGKIRKFKVIGITSNHGIFSLDNSNKFNIVAPLQTINSIYGTENKYNSVYLSINNDNINSWIKDFNEKNINLTAKLLVDESDINSQVNNIKIPLLFMLIIVLFMTIFIIHNSFKLTITERLSTIGTFLSLGATKFNIIKLFIKESLIYGIISGIIGNCIGSLIIYISSILINPFKEEGIKASVNFKPKYFIMGFILSILISLVSSILPIISIRKVPVKEVILGNFQSSNKISWKGFILGTVLLVLSAAFHIIGPNIKTPRPYVTAVPAFFIAFIGIIIIVPKIIEILLYPLVRLLRKIGGISMLSVNNIRTSKILINNIRLITICIISIIMIMSFSLSLFDLLGGVYKNLNFNVIVSVNSENGSTLKLSENIIENYTKKTDVIKRQYIYANLNKDSSKKIDLICIEPNNFKNYDNYMIYKDKNKQLNELDNNEDGIIISKKIATRYNIKEGDFINLNINDKSEKFKVLSVVDAKFMNMGNVNLISYKAALKHFGIRYANEFFISSNYPSNEVKKDLEKDFKGIDANVSTKEERMNEDQQNSNQVVALLKVFSYITIIMAAIGIVSNVSICFIQRKREMAILCSNGLTNGGRVFIILFENLIEGLAALIISFICSLWIIRLLQDIFNYLVLNMNFKYPTNSIIPITIISFLLMLITSIPALNKNRKFQIIDELKCE